MFTPSFFEDSHLDEYFSAGLKPPTRILISWCLSEFYSFARVTRRWRCLHLQGRSSGMEDLGNMAFETLKGYNPLKEDKISEEAIFKKNVNFQPSSHIFQ